MVGGRPAAKPEGQEIYESEVHALPIRPDVGYVRAIDLGEGRRLYVTDRDLMYAEGDQFYPVVVRGYPRLIGPSPSKQAVAFLEPSEFETAANLYVFDVPARTLRRLTDNDERSTLSVKAARWFDDRTIYYLEGYRYGTVSRGGDLWRADLESLSVECIVRIAGGGGKSREIVEFDFLPDTGLIRYVVVSHGEHGAETAQTCYCTLDGGQPPEAALEKNRGPASGDRPAP